MSIIHRKQPAPPPIPPSFAYALWTSLPGHHITKPPALINLSPRSQTIPDPVPEAEGQLFHLAVETSVKLKAERKAVFPLASPAPVRARGIPAREQHQLRKPVPCFKKLKYIINES